MHAGLQLEVGAHCTLQHPLSLCFLAPGIYSLYAYDVHQLSDQAVPSEQIRQHAADIPQPDNSLGVTAVNAVYFLVE